MRLESPIFCQFSPSNKGDQTRLYPGDFAFASVANSQMDPLHPQTSGGDLLKNTQCL